MAMRRAGIEIVVDDKGSATVQAVAKSFDGLAGSADHASASTKLTATEMRLLRDNLPDMATKTVDLSNVTRELGKESLQLAGHAINASYALDAFRDAEASSAQKMGALVGGMASLAGATKGLEKTWKEMKGAWDDAGGSVKNLLSGEVGMGAMVTVAVAAGTQVKALIETWAEAAESGMGAGDIFKEMIGIQTDLSGVTGTAVENTRKQGDVMKRLGELMGMSRAEMEKHGYSLENINRLAKDDKHPELTEALKVYRAEVYEVSNADGDRAAAAKAWQDGQAKAKKAIEDSTAALLAQKGILSDSEITKKQGEIAAGYDKIKSSAMGVGGAVKLFGGDMVELAKKILEQAGISQKAIDATGGSLTKLVALAQENKIILPAAFVEAGKAADELNKTLEVTTKWQKLIQQAADDYDKRREEERKKSKKNREEQQEQTEFELNNIKLITDAHKRAADERESYAKAKFTSDLSGSGDERVQVDKSSKTYKEDLARIKSVTDYSGFASAAVAALAAGDLVALKNIAKTIASDIAPELGIGGYGRQSYSPSDTTQRTTDLSGLMNSINEALKHLTGAAPQTEADRAAVDAARSAETQVRVLEEIKRGIADLGNRPIVIPADAIDRIISKGMKRADRGQNAPGEH